MTDIFASGGLADSSVMGSREEEEFPNLPCAFCVYGICKTKNVMYQTRKDFYVRCEGPICHPCFNEGRRTLPRNWRALFREYFLKITNPMKAHQDAVKMLEKNEAHQTKKKKKKEE